VGIAHPTGLHMSNSLSEQIIDLDYRIDGAHVNSPDATLWLEEITELLLADDTQTIDFLNSCNDKRVIYWTCPLFQDIALRFPSNRFSECLIFLINRYPENDELSINVKRALEINKVLMSDEG
jgi:hypothetical protein